MEMEVFIRAPEFEYVLIILLNGNFHFLGFFPLIYVDFQKNSLILFPLS